MNNNTVTSWIGWHRPSKRSPWRAAVEAPTEEAAFEQLLDSVPGGDKTILPSGQDPNTDHPAPRRRRF